MSSVGSGQYGSRPEIQTPATRPQRTSLLTIHLAADPGAAIWQRKVQRTVAHFSDFKAYKCGEEYLHVVSGSGSKRSLHKSRVNHCRPLNGERAADGSRDARHERSCRLLKQERVNFGGGGGILRRGERERRRARETEEINKLENETESEIATPDREPLPSAPTVAVSGNAVLPREVLPRHDWFRIRLSLCKSGRKSQLHFFCSSAHVDSLTSITSQPRRDKHQCRQRVAELDVVAYQVGGRRTMKVDGALPSLFPTSNQNKVNARMDFPKHRLTCRSPTVRPSSLCLSDVATCVTAVLLTGLLDPSEVNRKRCYDRCPGYTLLL